MRGPHTATMDDDPPICPACGVTMVPAVLSAFGSDGDWACLECEETGESDSWADFRDGARRGERRTLLTRPSSVKVRVGLLSPVSRTDLQVCARLVSAGMETINGCAVVTPGDGPEFVR